MQNIIFKKIISIVLLTAFLLNIVGCGQEGIRGVNAYSYYENDINNTNENEIVNNKYANVGGEMTVYRGAGNPSYPNAVAFPFYNIVVVNNKNESIINCYIMSDKLKTNGNKKILSVSDDINRTMLWDTVREINIEETIKKTGKSLIYCNSFESFNGEPLLIDGMGAGFIKTKSFSEWAVDDKRNQLTDSFLYLMKELNAYNKCGISEGKTELEINLLDGTSKKVEIDNFEAYLRGYNFETGNIEKENKPFVAICECQFVMGNKQCYWLDSKQVKHYNIDNKVKRHYYFENTSFNVKVSNSAIDARDINVKFEKNLQTANKILGSNVKNVGIVSF